MATVKLLSEIYFLLFFVFISDISAEFRYSDDEFHVELLQFSKIRNHEGSRDPANIQWLTDLRLNGHTHSLKDDARCEFCKYFVTAIDNELEGSRVLGPIVQFVNATCMSFSPLRPLCPLIVNETIKLFKELIQSEIGPEKACVAVGLCPNKTLGNVMRIENQLNNTVPLNKFTVLCFICDHLMEITDDMVMKIMNQIGDRLKSFCHKLTPPTDKKCLDSVVGLFEALEERLTKNILAPEIFCTKNIPVC